MSSNQYARVELDSFGNQYQSSGTAACIQQPRRVYRNNNGPCVEDYNPSRMLNSVNNMATYNSAEGHTRNQPLTHQMLMPPKNSVNSGMTSSSASNGMQIQVLPEFEPLPIGNATLQRFNPPHSIAISNGLHHSMLAQSIATSCLPGCFVPPTPSDVVQSSERWLDEIELMVSGISLEPMKGSAVALRLQNRSREVLTRYLPCVDFLVQCQQDLRKGLAIATRKRMVQHLFRDAMTPHQFYKSYISVLPERFYRKNRKIMEAQNLDAAYKELQKLCSNARLVQSQGCEAMKNTFLGGMKDGESWGLRKWLSKHGGALQICNDCECILNACQKLERSLDSTRRLGQRMRPLAEQALKKLKSDVPSSYQEQSSAHPYLPFFHRLESALRGISTFDPDDDDVICIEDDDEVEAIKSKAAATKSNSQKRKAEYSNFQKAAAPPKTFGYASDDDSVIEILDVKPKSSKRAKKSDFGNNDDAEYMKELLKTFDDDGSNDYFDQSFFATSPNGGKKDSFDLAAGLDRLAGMFDTNQHWNIRPNNIPANLFWDMTETFSSTLHLFSQILRTPDSTNFLDPVDENDFPAYSQVVKHPLCLRDIVSALLEESDDTENSIVGSTGILPSRGLASWNMWHGKDLLQAIDLVFLNSLGYGKAAQEGRSNNRSKTNKLRKILWEGIKSMIDVHAGDMDQEERRRCTPTRRGDTSGFVIYKDKC